MAISVYRKNENFDPLSHADDLYQLQDFRIENCEDIIELNEKEFLGYKKMISSESLELKVYNNENYQVKKVNSIKTEVDKKDYILQQKYTKMVINYYVEDVIKYLL